MLIYISIAAGGALGGVARYGLSGFVGRRVGETFPWGTLAVNVSGAFLIGVAWTVLGDAGDAWRFVAYGMIGSYTTVSSFSLQTLTLAREGRLGAAAGNVGLSSGACLAAVAAGIALGTAL